MVLDHGWSRIYPCLVTCFTVAFEKTADQRAMFVVRSPSRFAMSYSGATHTLEWPFLCLPQLWVGKDCGTLERVQKEMSEILLPSAQSNGAGRRKFNPLSRVPDCITISAQRWWSS